MKEYTDKLDAEIIELKKDSNRILSTYSEFLVEFAKYLWNVKKDHIATKNSYDINIQKYKNDMYERLIEERKKLEEENALLESPVKLKDFKITDAELNRYAEYKLVDLYRQYKDLESEIECVQIIYDAYVRHFYSIRDDRDIVITESKFYK